MSMLANKLGYCYMSIKHVVLHFYSNDHSLSPTTLFLVFGFAKGGKTKSQVVYSKQLILRPTQEFCIGVAVLLTVMFNLTGLNYFGHFPSSLP